MLAKAFGGLGLLLAVLACGAEPKLSAEETARAWLASGMAGDVDRLVSLTCLARRETVRVMGEVARRNVERARPSTTDLEEQLADLDLRVATNDGGAALVRTGYLDSGMHLVLEDGEWRVCPPPGPAD